MKGPSVLPKQDWNVHNWADMCLSISGACILPWEVGSQSDTEHASYSKRKPEELFRGHFFTGSTEGWAKTWLHLGEGFTEYPFSVHFRMMSSKKCTWCYPKSSFNIQELIKIWMVHREKACLIFLANWASDGKFCPSSIQLIEAFYFDKTHSQRSKF